MRRTPWSLTAGVVGSACLLILGGCGSSGSSTTTVLDSPAGQTTHTTQLVKRIGPSYRLLSKKQLTRVLVGIEDLPAGYSQDPPSSDPNDKTFCDYRQPFTARVKVTREFTKGIGLSGELLGVGLRQYANVRQAKIAFAALVTTLKTCRTDTDQGSRLTYSPMSAPKVGDASIGVRIKSDNATVLQTFALVGPTLINAGGGGLVNTSGDDINRLLQTQVNAYRQAAKH